MKITCCWLFIAGLTTTAVAQKVTYVSWGIVGGVSSTTIAFKDKGSPSTPSTAAALNFDRSTDLTGGLFAEMKFTKHSWLTIRHDLTHRKYDTSSDDFYGGTGQTTAFGTVTANYIKYSLSFRAAITKDKLQPFIGLGLSPSFLLKQTNDYRINSSGIPLQRQPLFSGTSSVDFGFFGAAGINYNRATLEVRVERSTGLMPSEMKSPVGTVYILLSYKLLDGVL